MAEQQRQILELKANQKESTPTKLLKNNKTKVKEETVGEFYTELLLHSKQSDKTGNRLVYKMSYNSIKEFANGRLNILFAEIDLKWLNMYEKWFGRGLDSLRRATALKPNFRYTGILLG